MTATELIARTLATDLDFLRQLVSDITTDELLVRPVDGANHGLWALGHLSLEEANALRPFNEATPDLPAEFRQRFDNAHQGSATVAELADKEYLLEVLTQVRQSTIAFVETLSDEDLDQQTGLAMAPSLGDLLILQSSHLALHAGQIQVLRRKLGKPVLF